jgi:ATP-binding cassette subfamily F protein 3
MDEPTNHLDLEMRHALSLALAEYSGALVVISHDRHLLRSVCDDFFIVHDGGVNFFRESLDAYPDWLREQEKQGESRSSLTGKKSKAGKRQIRQEQAQYRAQLKPWLELVRNLDKEMANLQIELELVEKQLTDDRLYNSDGKQQELTDLLRKQGGMRSRLEKAEHDWLEANEALEKAKSAQ